MHALLTAQCWPVLPVGEQASTPQYRWLPQADSAGAIWRGLCLLQGGIPRLVMKH